MARRPPGRRGEEILALGVFHDAAAVRHLGGIVGAADLVVEQLAPRITHQAEELGRPPQQLPGLIQLLDPPGQHPEEVRQAVRPGVIVHFVVFGHAAGMIIGGAVWVASPNWTVRGPNLAVDRGLESLGSE